MRNRNAAIVSVLLGAALGCGGSDGPKDSRPVGTVTDQKTVTIGGEAVSVTLGRGRERVEVQFPADAVPRRTQVTVRTEENVPKKGPTPAGGTALHVATQNLTFQPAARMRQPVMPPPAGRQYAAVHAQPEAESWAQRAPARAMEMTDDGRQIFEIDVSGSGLWALALVDGLVDAGAPDAAPDAPFDGAPPRGSDAAPVDAAPDAGPDGGAADRAPDAAADLGSDLAADTGGDVGPRAIPQLSGLSPTTGTAGAAAMLTLVGSNFEGDATVLFAGQRLATVRDSSTQVRADVTAALTMQPGQYAIWIENGAGPGASRSNTLYFTINPAPGAPVVVDYSPDNGVPGDKVLVVGTDLMGANLKITDANGLAAAPGMFGSTSWSGGTRQTVEITLPAGWTTGPITVAHDRGIYRGRIFNVGRNLAQQPGAMLAASSEYSTTWAVARGGDNQLVTSWFSRGGDCASLPSCTSVPWYRVSFAAPTTVARIGMRGNREYESGYDFLRGKFEVLGANNAVLWSASYDLPQPDRDLDIVLPTPLGNVISVRFTSEKDESNEPGFSELEVFGP